PAGDSGGMPAPMASAPADEPEEVSSVKVGIPREVKDHEYRVAITPAGTHELVRAGHEVLIETGAGAGSSIPDEEYAAARALVLPAADRPARRPRGRRRRRMSQKRWAP